MKAELKQWLIARLEEEGYGTTDDDIWELVTESNEVASEDAGSHRWWDDYLKTYEVVSSVDPNNKKFVQLLMAETTGDESAYDKGWEKDVDDMREVFPVTKTVTITTYE
jgi:hypothetical protein